MTSISIDMCKICENHMFQHHRQQPKVSFSAPRTVTKKLTTEQHNTDISSIQHADQTQGPDKGNGSSD